MVIATRPRAFASFVLRACLLAACGGAVSACDAGGERDRARGVRLAKSEQAIGGGSDATADLEELGVVQIRGSGRGTCTGKLLAQRWVLTAASCLCASDGAAPGNLEVVLGERVAKVTKVELHSAQVAPNPPIVDNFDFALLRLDRFLPVPRAARIYPIESGFIDTAAPIVCFGYTSLTEDDAGVPLTSAPTRIEGTMVPSSHALTDPNHTVTWGAVSNACGNGGNHYGIDVAVPESTVLDPSDLGGPCFVEGTGGKYDYIGYVYTMAAPGRMHVVTVEYMRGWLPKVSDLWTQAQCLADIPDTRFALAPTAFVGIPDPATITVVARNAYGDPEDAGSPQVYVRQSSDPRSATWSTLHQPVIQESVEDVSAAPDATASPLARPLIWFQYANERQELRSFWLDPTTGDWLVRPDLDPATPHTPFSGIGLKLSDVRSLHAPAMSHTAEPPGKVLYGPQGGFISPSGRPTGTGWLRTDDQSVPDSIPVYGWLTVSAPDDAPRANATLRGSVITRAPYFAVLYYGLAYSTLGYLDVSGRLVSRSASTRCIYKTVPANPYCPIDTDFGPAPTFEAPLQVWDIPATSLRDVALGMIAKPRSGAELLEDAYFVVAAERDGALRLWSLGDGMTNHAEDFGALGDMSLGQPAVVTVNPGSDYEQFYVVYTGRSWSLRIRPVDACVGTTPTWW